LARYVVVEKAGVTPKREALIGDLIEQYRRRRSSAWNWRQGLAAISVTAYQDIRDHKLLAVRVILTASDFRLLELFALGFVIRNIFHGSFARIMTLPPVLLWKEDERLRPAAQGSTIGPRPVRCGHRVSRNAAFSSAEGLQHWPPYRLYVHTVPVGHYERSARCGPPERGELEQLTSKRPGLFTGATQATADAYFFDGKRWVSLLIAD
jgi:hypothetical protein